MLFDKMIEWLESGRRLPQGLSLQSVSRHAMQARRRWHKRRDANWFNTWIAPFLESHVRVRRIRINPRCGTPTVAASAFAQV